MSKHTSGKWEIMHEDGVMSGNYRGIVAGKGYLDKQTNTGFTVTAWMSESDARLISCAPEMYETLKAIAGRFDATDCDEIFRAHELLARIEGAE